jgi:hypothetical protein
MVAMDRANAPAVEKLSIHMKNALKSVRQNREVSNKYLDDFDPVGGSYLDKKN